MSQAPTSPTATEPANRYEPPRNTQFSVFLDNRVGKMLELLEVFEGQALTLAALAVSDAADHAVVRVITSNANLARRLLARAELPFSEIDVLVIETNPAQTFHDICIALLHAEVNIHYAYPLLVQPRGRPAIVLFTDDNTLAGTLLRRKLYTLLGENDLGENRSHSTPDGPTSN
jgi:hypothetical protein